MSTIEKEKVKNWYNAGKRTHSVGETSLPRDPPTQYIQVWEEEQTPQARKIAPKKRIREDSACKSSRKWKVNPLNIGVS